MGGVHCLIFRSHRGGGGDGGVLLLQNPWPGSCQGVHVGSGEQNVGKGITLAAPRGL